MLELWGDVGFIVFTVSSTLFTLMYLTMSKWYSSFMGTLIALFMFGVAIISAYFSLRIWGVHVPGVDWVRLVVFWTLGISMLTATVSFLEIQFGRRAARLRQRLSRKYVDVKSREIKNNERL